MTSLLTHTVAHSTRPSFRPKTNKVKSEVILVDSYEVHPIGGEIEETHRGYTCSHCTQRFNISIFIIAVLNKSETVLGCKSK